MRIAVFTSKMIFIAGLHPYYTEPTSILPHLDKILNVIIHVHKLMTYFAILKTIVWQLLKKSWGNSHLSIAGKVLARVLLNRLQKHPEEGLLPESQCGFRKGKGTVDIIFAARQLQEKCSEQNLDVYTTWKIMSKFGCPDNFHDGMQAIVQDNGEHSASFPVMNGIKQGCVLAPTLYSMVFSAMLNDVHRESKVGLSLSDRCKLFNLWRLQAKTKVTN